MLSEAERIVLLDDDAAVSVIAAEKVLHHLERLCGCHNSCIRIEVQEVCDICGVIGLHVLHNEIIRLSAVQRSSKVIEPLMRKIAVNGIHDGNLLIHDDIRIIRHAVRDVILPLKQIDLMVVDADIADVGCNIHCNTPLLYIFCCFFAFACLRAAVCGATWYGEFRALRIRNVFIFRFA